MGSHDLLHQWPTGPDGKLDPPALLKLESDFSGYRDICCSMLDSFGIPFLTQRPGLGEISFIQGGFSPLGVEIFVPTSRLEEAEELLRTPVEHAGDGYKEETQ